MITMEHVCKSYKVAKRKVGFSEACKSLFRREHEVIHALQDVSFTEYSCAMKSHFRKSGNQMSEKWKSSFASLLAQCFV